MKIGWEMRAILAFIYLFILFYFILFFLFVILSLGAAILNIYLV